MSEQARGPDDTRWVFAPGPNRAAFLRAVVGERVRQEVAWGPAHDRGHTPELWIALLGERVGIAASAVVNALNDGEYERALVQVAALALAALEADRDALLHMDRLGEPRDAADRAAGGRG